MPILRDIPIVLDPEAVVAVGRGQPPRPELLRAAGEAIALGHTLWQPMALYDRFGLQAVEGGCVTLVHPSGAEAILHVGPPADLLIPAVEVLVSVMTIGPALEQRVHELQLAGEGLTSYLLDSAGVLALGAVGEAVRGLAEEAAAAQGWGVSPALSPGSLVGWPVRGQRELCALLPLEEIGVHLNNYCVLVPHKSASVLIGLGPGYQARHVGSLCQYCALQDTCWQRRKDPNQKPGLSEAAVTLDPRSGGWP